MNSKADAKAKVKVTLSPILRHLSQLNGEPEAWEVRAAHALDCLQVMMKRYPSIGKWAYDKDGKLLPLIWFFVNDLAMDNKLAPDEFTKPLRDGDEVIIFFAKV